jgi:hypothetical protein
LTDYILLICPGAHDADNFASIIVSYLKKYELASKLSAMTADNISTNAAIGRVIGSTEGIDFDHKTQVHGCVAHVINLAAKEGLKVFGELLDGNKAEPTSNIHNLVDPPDVLQVNLKTIYNRCHGLVTCTRSSPQRAQAFANIVKSRRDLEIAMAAAAAGTNPPTNSPTDPPTNTLSAPNDPTAEELAEQEAVEFMLQDPTIDHVQPARPKKNTATQLIVDVPTRWNSSYHMFQRLLRLKDACDEFCKARDFRKYALLSIEWNYVKQMCEFLEPLSEATEILCKSKFPTMHQVVPMYIVVLQGLKSVSHSFSWNLHLHYNLLT